MHLSGAQQSTGYTDTLERWDSDDVLIKKLSPLLKTSKACFFI